ncbi:MAG: 23S rRNA (adenine(2503)-C(2))-methyltransferase RlmN [Candidatus Moraniibacteriota bacterium]
MDLVKLENFLAAEGQPKFRQAQIKRAIFKEGVASFNDISTLSKELRDILTLEIPILSFTVEKVLIAKDKQALKALLKLADGQKIETVLISSNGESWSACVSSQVGCPLACGFCATGRGGFKRNLSSEEITDQILFWRQYLKNELKLSAESLGLTNVVYMGMGEPFLNWEAVAQSLRDLTNQDLYGFGSRSISVSTAGIVEGIEKMADNFPQINLALSLHFANDKKRGEIMPVNQRNDLASLRQALRNYFQKSKRKVFLEYVLLEGINDSYQDALELINFVKSIDKLQLLWVNLIRYNSTAAQFRSSSKAQTLKFRDYLKEGKVGVTIRKSLGGDIEGACGQLLADKS